MTDLEKLAREICWAGFNFPPKGGKIKYWANIAPSARASYVETAKQFVWIAQRLGIETISAFVPNRVPVASTESAEHGSHDRP